MRGGQWQALHLIQGLASAGHGVRLLARRGSPLLEAAINSGLDAAPLSIASVSTSAHGFDLIHAHDARAHTISTTLAKALIVSRRVAFPIRRSLASRWKYSLASHYIAVSQFVHEILVESGIAPERISIVYDGVQPFRDAVPAPPRTLVVALDSDDPKKGKRIVQEAAQLANINVHFSKNLIDDLPRAAAFVYITESEGLGSAALLAMAAGAPVLASRIGGLPEIVEDGLTGLLTSNNAADIAAGIKRLVHDRPLAERLAAAARDRVEKNFTVDRMVRETLRVYERILS